MKKQNADLENAKKISYEAHDIAIDVEKHLNDQNVRAVHSQTNAQSIHGMLDESDSVIARMLRRERLNKLILALIVGALVIALIIILYYKFFN